MDWIDQYAKSSYQLFANHDPQSHMPFDAWGLHPLYNDLWLEKLHELVNKFNENGYSIKDHLNYFPNLSSTRFLVLMTIIHYQTSKMDDPHLITNVVDFLVESIRLRAKKDLFAIKSNIEFRKKDFENILTKNPLKAASLEESQELGKIFVALASLTHGLYNDWCTDYNYEISGPYKVKGKMILLRSFPDNKPAGIWPDIKWKYKNISIVTEYEKLEAKIAFVGCHITYSDNVVQKLTGYSLKVDDKIIHGLSNLKKLRQDLMEISANQYEEFMNMDFEKQKIKYLEQENYQLKKLFDLVNMDWRPSALMLKRVKDKKLIKNVFPNYHMSLASYKKTFGINNLIKAYKTAGKF